MSSKKFEVTDASELRAMQRIMREAKFCTEADDTDISSSPMVARLFERLMNALIEAEVEEDGEDARTRWLNWLNLDDPRRDEWQAAIRRAANDMRWMRLTDEEKRDFSRNLLSPFRVSADVLSEFVISVEKLIRHGKG